MQFIFGCLGSIIKNRTWLSFKTAFYVLQIDTSCNTLVKKMRFVLRFWKRASTTRLWANWIIGKRIEPDFFKDVGRHSFLTHSSWRESYELKHSYAPFKVEFREKGSPWKKDSLVSLLNETKDVTTTLRRPWSCPVAPALIVWWHRSAFHSRKRVEP